MDKVEIKGAIKGYLRLPLYMLIPIVLTLVSLCVYENKFIMHSVVIVALYAVVAVVSYIVLQKRCIKSLVDMATQIETSQRSSIENMVIPYAILEKTGRIMWENNSFTSIFGEQTEHMKNVSSLFKEIGAEELRALDNERKNIYINYNDRNYLATLDKITQGEAVEEEVTLYALMLFDETEKVLLSKKLEAQKLVVANISIDNYEEMISTVDEVKASLLQGVTERKIRKYFGAADAIIKKLEKDKFFLVFPKRFLGNLVEDKFSILEEIKNTKFGNDLQVTISVGIGLNGETYAKDFEYAKTAMSLALGRGGSQVVIKEGREVSIYGIKGKEITKNARVKARVKAEALREIMETRERILIMGHGIGDTDCVGAAIGIFAAARDLGKPANIILNTITRSLRPIIETFTEDEAFPEDLFITSERALEILDEDTLVVIVDTNRRSNSECPEIFNKTKNIVVIDHHRQGIDTITDTILSYIEPYASSTCEMVAEILQYFSDSIQITYQEADALYAGMLIDTNNFMAKTGVRTFEAAAYLRRMGAEASRVRKLLREDINAYKARAEIVRQATVYREAFAISVCDTPDLESPTVVGAQASNELLNIVGIKASFVLTEYRGKIFVSSRSIDEIDVQLVMERLGGGGHLNIAGAQIDDSTVDEVIEKIKGIIDDMIEEGLIK